jgi:hypothetical protein
MSSQIEALGLNLNLLIGPLVAGAMTTCFLHCLVIQQGAAYYQRCWRSDPVFIRIWVCVAIALSTSSAIVCAVFAYLLVVHHFGDLVFLAGRHVLMDVGGGKRSLLFGLPNLSCCLPALIGLSGTCLQSFLIYRVYRLFDLRLPASGKC